ncbi:MAG: NlpC/P60 family protein [Desulfurivibrionaceae bacterium]
MMEQGFLTRSFFPASCLMLVFFFAGLSGCGGLGQEGVAPPRAAPPRAAPQKKLAMLGHSIQVGAFANLDNAVRLMRKLDDLGLDAYYYRHASGLYKVRFGDYPSRKEAESRAVQLREAGLIEEFYLVAPEHSAAARFRRYQEGTLRKMLVSTAEGFLGIPYEWGGESAETGFDCSGLAMTVYKLNGLNLPRNSKAQYQAGSPVRRADLAPGDLVFFATNGDATVSHVGIYTGNGRFIHASKKGESIRQSSLRNGYFDGCYVGARTYLGKDG